MTSKLPFMKFYVNDFLADTEHLSTEEKGIYMLLLIAMWRKADAIIPNDDRKLANIAGLSRRKWLAERPLIMEFLTEVMDGKGLTQKRLRSEQIRAGLLSHNRSIKAKKLWDMKAKKFNGVSTPNTASRTGSNTGRSTGSSTDDTRAFKAQSNSTDTSQSLPDDLPHADALGAAPAGPPAEGQYPHSPGLLKTRLYRNVKGDPNWRD